MHTVSLAELTWPHTTQIRFEDVDDLRMYADGPDRSHGRPFAYYAASLDIGPHLCYAVTWRNTPCSDDDWTRKGRIYAPTTTLEEAEDLAAELNVLAALS
jgi:hypothetical protein